MILNEEEKIDVHMDYISLYPIRFSIGDFMRYLSIEKAQEIAIKMNNAVQDYLITEGERAEVKDDDTQE